MLELNPTHPGVSWSILGELIELRNDEVIKYWFRNGRGCLKRCLKERKREREEATNDNNKMWKLAGQRVLWINGASGWSLSPLHPPIGADVFMWSQHLRPTIIRTWYDWLKLALVAIEIIPAPRLIRYYQNVITDKQTMTSVYIPLCGLFIVFHIRLVQNNQIFVSKHVTYHLKTFKHEPLRYESVSLTLNSLIGDLFPP